MTTIKLMTDYNCYAIWQSVDDSVFENIDPKSLNISDDLFDKINNWEDEFENTFNSEDPSKSGFPDKDAEISHELKGVQIWKQLINEIDFAEVIFYSLQDGKTFTWSEYNDKR